MEVQVITIPGEVITNETGPRVLDCRTAGHQQVNRKQLLRFRGSPHDGLVHFILVVMVVREALMCGVSGIRPCLMPNVLHAMSGCTIEVTMQCSEWLDIRIENTRAMAHLLKRYIIPLLVL